MPLSKSTTDQIRKEAEALYPIDEEDCFENDNKASGYIQGATIWAQEKEGLVKALEEIGNNPMSNFYARNVALTALEAWKK
jgi:hypothetical protein